LPANEKTDAQKRNLNGTFRTNSDSLSAVEIAELGFSQMIKYSGQDALEFIPGKHAG
jgi:hypothetical protein